MSCVPNDEQKFKLVNSHLPVSCNLLNVHLSSSLCGHYVYLILSRRMSTKSSRACLYALMITVGCICCSRKGPATVSISPAVHTETEACCCQHSFYYGIKKATLQTRQTKSKRNILYSNIKLCSSL